MDENEEVVSSDHWNHKIQRVGILKKTTTTKTNKNHHHNLNTVKVAKHWNGQAGEPVKFLFLEIFKTSLVKVRYKPTVADSTVTGQLDYKISRGPLQSEQFYYSGTWNHRRIIPDSAITGINLRVWLSTSTRIWSRTGGRKPVQKHNVPYYHTF